MIPNETKQTVLTSGEQVRHVGNFRITDATQARILVSLSDKIYTRKELAVIREYANNMADAQIASGKNISDCVITFPSADSLVFKVRDFGAGLTEDEIRDVYCVFGESTRRNSNDYNGTLGFGCKSGYCHTDSFSVTSWINGEKSIYQCVKGDSTRLHEALLLSRSISNEPNGIEVCIPVKQTSMWTFHREAANFFKYWKNLPTLVNLNAGDVERMNAFRNTSPALSGEGWEVRPKSCGSAEGVAFMGGVPYRIDWNTIQSQMALDSKKRAMFDLLQSNDTTFYFGMGDIQFVDSREGLEYTEITVAALIRRIEDVFSKIQEAIQAKFTPAANLWEAKMIYNAIFGTGIIEVEKGESADCIDKIKILDGNFVQLEHTFQGAFTWNGIVINGPWFDKINRFDNLNPSVIGEKNSNPDSPVMITYRKKKSRAKVNRCTHDSSNCITVSPQVAVVLNDTGLKSGHSGVARYIMLNDNSKIRTVHILTFADAEIKSNFYKEYNFDSVPVIRMSEILADSRAWNKTNRTLRSYGSGTGGGTGGARMMEYMDIDNNAVQKSDVPIREIENGGFYIDGFLETPQRGRRRHGRTRKMQAKYINGLVNDADIIMSQLRRVSESMGLDLNRIYIITEKTRDSKWFTQAVSSGEWINVWEHVKENVDALNASELVNFFNFSENRVVDPSLVMPFLAQVRNNRSVMLQVISCQGRTDYEDSNPLINALQRVQMWDTMIQGISPTVDFNLLKKRLIEAYPFLSSSSAAIANVNYMDDEQFANIVKYINALDAYAEPVVETVPVASEDELISMKC